jgi:hypothetical protein
MMCQILCGLSPSRRQLSMSRCLRVGSVFLYCVHSSTLARMTHVWHMVALHLLASMGLIGGMYISVSVSKPRLLGMLLDRSLPAIAILKCASERGFCSVAGDGSSLACSLVLLSTSAVGRWQIDSSSS